MSGSAAVFSPGANVAALSAVYEQAARLSFASALAFKDAMAHPPEFVFHAAEPEGFWWMLQSIDAVFTGISILLSCVFAVNMTLSVCCIVYYWLDLKVSPFFRFEDRAGRVASRVAQPQYPAHDPRRA